MTASLFAVAAIGFLTNPTAADQLATPDGRPGDIFETAEASIIMSQCNMLEMGNAMTDVNVGQAMFALLTRDNCRLDIAGRYIRLPYHGTESHKTLGN